MLLATVPSGSWEGHRAPTAISGRTGPPGTLMYLKLTFISKLALENVFCVLMTKHMLRWHEPGCSRASPYTSCAPVPVRGPSLHLTCPQAPPTPTPAVSGGPGMRGLPQRPGKGASGQGEWGGVASTCCRTPEGRCLLLQPVHALQPDAGCASCSRTRCLQLLAIHLDRGPPGGQDTLFVTRPRVAPAQRNVQGGKGGGGSSHNRERPAEAQC